MRNFLFTSLFVAMAIILVSGCNSSPGSGNNAAGDRETLFQVSTINALMAGVYDGTVSGGQLKTHGDFGIGTFTTLDGEMLELDGVIYQIKSDGVAYTAIDSQTVPFAAVTFFDSDRQEKIASGLDLVGLQAALDKSLTSFNLFYAFKIDGQFSYMKTRSVPAQSKPYPVLTEVTKKQAVFEFSNIRGTIVGFRCPQFVNGVNVPGYHLHFLTSDHRAGGHVLDLKTTDVTARVDDTPNFLMSLPDISSDFYKIDLSGDQQNNIQKAEK
jgi:acetolactate decarboxylase